MVTAEPADDLCATGNVAGPVGNGPWNWSCVGINGGMTVSCTAPLQPPDPINGACGEANGVATLVKPQSALCSAGILGTVNGDGPWTWTCSGANGGNPASCVAPIAGRVGAMPSTMEPSSNLAITDGAAAPASPSGLVTPRLPPADHLAAMDREAMPSLTPSNSLKTPPLPSQIPPGATVQGDDVAATAPDLPQGMEPVQPPAVGDALPSDPVLHEEAASPHTPGNHLTLDPTISTILFSQGSGNIDDAVLSTLNKLAVVLNANPDARIALTAYANNDGSTPRGARRLSLTRALAVRDYLQSKGVSPSRVDVHAEGANTTTGYIDRVDVKVND
jgi:outer membrane protein OmpA-like peptidoglycan-associated protein